MCANQLVFMWHMYANQLVSMWHVCANQRAPMWHTCANRLGSKINKESLKLNERNPSHLIKKLRRRSKQIPHQHSWVSRRWAEPFVSTGTCKHNTTEIEICTGRGWLEASTRCWQGWANRNSRSWLVIMQTGGASAEDSLAVSYKAKYNLSIWSISHAPQCLPNWVENLWPPRKPAYECL